VSRSRLAAAIAIPLLLALGLAFTFLQGRHPAGQAGPTTVAPSSSLPPPPTTSKPNPPKATGEDWLAIMSDILTYRHQLYEHPQPNLLSQIYDKRCPCFAQERNVLADLQRRGLKYTDRGVQVLQAKLRGRGVGNSSIVAIESVIQTAQQVLEDRDGKVVQRKAASGPTKMTYELVRGQDGRWRVSFTLVGWIGG
jgi:hypothetical protein